MANQNNNVMKALSPEEMTELSNVKSLIEEIMSMNQAGQDMGVDVGTEKMDASAMQQPGAMMAKAATEPAQNLDKSPEDEMEAPTGKPEDAEKAKKAIENTPGDAPAAQDPYENRMEDPLPEGSEEALMEVAKALQKMFIGKSSSVKKSAPVNPLVQVQTETARVIKAQAEQIAGLTNAVSAICDGLGITKQLEVAQKAQKKEPVVSQDSSMVLKQLADLINGNKVEKSQGNIYGNYSSQGEAVRKNLSNPTLMSYMGMDASDNEIVGE